MSSLIAKEGENKPRQQPPAGTHVARCISIVDTGTHENDYGKETRRIRITWELPEEKAVFKQDKGEQPFIVNKQYTLSLFEKANLRYDLESWRGKALSPEELEGFDVFAMISEPCLLSLIHKTSDRNGQTYTNISGITTLAKGMKCPPQINPSVTYSVDEGQSTTYLAMPEWLQEQIAACKEWETAEGSVKAEGLEAPPKEGDPDFPTVGEDPNW